MNEYIEINHMSEINPLDEQVETNNYYMPHHAVVGEQSKTTKVRVVFERCITCRANYSKSVIFDNTTLSQV